MKRLHSFIRLPATQRWLLIRASLLLWATRIGLWLLPFQMLRRLLAAFASRPMQVQDTERFSKASVVWAVEALAAQVLLAWRGYPALLRIGVVKGDKDDLQAHAWVESEGEVVISGYELERYAHLATLR